MQIQSKMNTNKNTMKIENCSFIKMMLMLCVVIYHCILFWSENWFTENPVFKSEFLKFFSTWLGSFHVYSFVFVSGYLFFYLCYEKEKYQEFKSFLFNKVKRLIVPYVFIAVLWVGPIYCYFFGFDRNVLIHKFLWAEGPSQLWFLWMLFDVYMIFWLFRKFFYNYNVWGIIFVVILYGIGVLGNDIIPNVFQIWTACTYLIFFWMGFKIRQYYKIYERINNYLFWIVLDVFLFVMIQFIPNTGMVLKLINKGLTISLHVVGTIMAFVTLNELAGRVNQKCGKVIKMLSKFSMSIYLFHQQVIYFLIYILNGIVNPYINSIANFVAAMIVSIVISALLMKFRVTRFLIGEK